MTTPSVPRPEPLRVDEDVPRPVSEELLPTTEVYHPGDNPDVTEDIPIPFTVVELAPDKPDVHNGDPTDAVERLDEDPQKRQADADPDQVDSSAKADDTQSHSTDHHNATVPSVVIDKSDARLEHGDDFGDQATSAQSVAHEKRMSDATPDEIIIHSEASNPDETKNIIADADVEDRQSHSTEQGRKDSAPKSKSGIQKLCDDMRTTPASMAKEVAAKDSSDASEDGPTPASVKDDLSAFAAACGHRMEFDSPRIEHAPLFTHECLGESDNSPSPSLLHLRKGHQPSSLKSEMAIYDSDSPSPTPRSPSRQFATVGEDSPHRSEHSPALESISEEGTNRSQPHSPVQRSITGSRPISVREQFDSDVSIPADPQSEDSKAEYFGGDEPDIPLGVVHFSRDEDSNEPMIMIEPADDDDVAGDHRAQMCLPTILRDSTNDEFKVLDGPGVAREGNDEEEDDAVAPSKQAATALKRADQHTLLQLLWRMLFLDWLVTIVSRVTGSKRP